ncbi:MAG: branched-chain amino acid ABC transporter permease [Rhodospirillales bacterium]|nr:branched-chain amino acid ABC transporter permease [Rhodospirillales bacterium]
MSSTVLLAQALNGLQLAMLLFLLAAGLTLVFGIMDLINLAHGVLYMMGGYFAATVFAVTGSFWLAVATAIPLSFLLGVALEVLLMRYTYKRNHMDQVLVTFGVLVFFEDLVKLIWGNASQKLTIPDLLQGQVEVLPDVVYPVYRLAIIALGVVVVLALYVLVQRTRLGMLIRAGASNRRMVSALGVNIGMLFTLVFALGATLAGLAGAVVGPVTSVEPGMGNHVLILSFVIVVVGGIGSIPGALVAALALGMIDTVGRTLIGAALHGFLPPAVASGVTPALASMLLYVMMAAVLVLRPSGLFPAPGR